MYIKLGQNPSEDGDNVDSLELPGFDFHLGFTKVSRSRQTTDCFAALFGDGGILGSGEQWLHSLLEKSAN